MKEIKKLKNIEQVTLFMYVLAKGLPAWSAGDCVKVFAAIRRIPRAQAQKWFDQTKAAGYIENGPVVQRRK